MQSRDRGGAIRLTNKTAIALRRSAQKVQRAYMAAAVVLSLLLAGAAVYLGMMWLPAVPMIVAGTAALDALLMLHARRCYLQLVGQAICTEAAARGMREALSAKERRMQAVSDVMTMQRDVRRAMDEQEAAEDDDLYDVPPARKPAPASVYPSQPAQAVGEVAPAHRRRRALTVIKSEK